MTTHISFGLEGRVAVVTGGAQGIGEACVRRLRQDGAQVVVVDIASERGHALADAIGASFVHTDVGNKSHVDAMVARVMRQHGRIDILVNNAGIFKSAPFLEMSEADFDAVLRVNLKGAFLVGQAAAREMARAGHGAIINMSSVNGAQATPGLAGYNVSKGGMNQLTRAMALALAEHGVRVNAVAPGTIATELATQAVLGDEAARQRVLSRTPMKRLGTPEEVAGVVCWLASDAASYMTGEIVTVDGGRATLNYTVPT